MGPWGRRRIRAIRYLLRRFGCSTSCEQTNSQSCCSRGLPIARNSICQEPEPLFHSERQSDVTACRQRASTSGLRFESSFGFRLKAGRQLIIRVLLCPRVCQSHSDSTIKAANRIPRFTGSSCFLKSLRRERHVAKNSSRRGLLLHG